MSKELSQEWITVEIPPGPNAVDVIQPEEDWFNGPGLKSMAIMNQTVGCGPGVDFFWETADDPKGPWRMLGSPNQMPETGPEYASFSMGGTGTDVPDLARVQQYTRWHVRTTPGTPPYSGGYVCFRAMVVAK